MRSWVLPLRRVPQYSPKEPSYGYIFLDALLNGKSPNSGVPPRGYNLEPLHYGATYRPKEYDWGIFEIYETIASLGRWDSIVQYSRVYSIVYSIVKHSIVSIA